MPIDNVAIKKTTNAWWHQFKPLIFSSPVEIAQFIIQHPASTASLLKDQRAGLFSRRNFRNEILNDPHALGVILSAPNLKLPDDFSEVAINSNFKNQIENVAVLTEKSISAIGRSADKDELAPYAFTEVLNDQFAVKKEGEVVILHKKGIENKQEAERKVVRLGGNCYYFVQENLPVGITQHQELPWLYASLSPEFARQNEIEIDGKKVDELEYVKATAGAINETHPTKKQIVLVLGKREDNENNKFYSEHSERFSQNANQKITHDVIEKDKLGFKTDIYYVQAEGADKLNLDSQALELLYKVIRQGQEEKASVRVHCRQGVDRTGAFVFAIQLLNKFDQIFSGTEGEIAAKLKKEHMILRESRGPDILKYSSYYEMSIRLAFALRAVEQQEKYENKLHAVAPRNAMKTLRDFGSEPSIAEKKQYLNEEINNPENSVEVKTCLVNLLKAVENREVTERKLEEKNEFKSTQITTMALNFVGLIADGAPKKASLGGEGVVAITKESDSLVEKLSALKAYWENIAKLARFSDDALFKDMFTKFVNVAGHYLTTKEKLNGYIKEINGATDYKSKSEITAKIKQLKLTDLETLQAVFVHGFPVSNKNLGLRLKNDTASAVKTLNDLRENSILEIWKDFDFKYPALQRFLSEMSPMNKGVTKQQWLQDDSNPSKISAEFYNDVKLITELLEVGKFATDNSEPTRKAIERIFSNDEMLEYTNRKITPQGAIKQELFNAIKQARPDYIAVLKAEQDQVNQNAITELMDVNLLDFDDTLITYTADGRHEINQNVIAEINDHKAKNDNRETANYIFTQRNIVLSKSKINIGSAKLSETIPELAEKHQIKIDGVSSSSDHLLASSKGLDGYFNELSAFEKIMQVDTVPSSPEIQVLVDVETQGYAEQGAKQPLGKIKQYIYFVKQLEEKNPGKAFNVTLMDDSFDNLIEIKTYFDRMEEMHKLGLAAAQIIRPKLIWVEKNSRGITTTETLSEAANVAQEIVEDKDLNKVAELLQKNKASILADLSALNILVERGEKSELVKGFLIENYVEIQKNYIENKNVITPLVFERKLKDINKDAQFVSFINKKLTTQPSNGAEMKSLEKRLHEMPLRIFDDFKEMGSNEQVQKAIALLKTTYGEISHAQKQGVNWLTKTNMEKIFTSFNTLIANFRGSGDNWNVFWQQQGDLIQREARKAGEPELSDSELNASIEAMKKELDHNYLFAVISKAYASEMQNTNDPLMLAVCEILLDVRKRYYQASDNVGLGVEELIYHYSAAIKELVNTVINPVTSNNEINFQVAKIVNNELKVAAAVIALGPEVKQNALTQIMQSLADKPAKLFAALNAVPAEQLDTVLKRAFPEKLKRDNIRASYFGMHRAGEIKLLDALKDVQKALLVIGYGNEKLSSQDLAKVLYKHKDNADFVSRIANDISLKERVYQIAKSDAQAALTIFQAKKYTMLASKNADKQDRLTPIQIIEVIKAHCQQEGFLKKLFTPFSISSNVDLVELSKSSLQAFQAIIATPQLLAKLSKKNMCAIETHYLTNLKGELTKVSDLFKLFDQAKDQFEHTLSGTNGYNDKTQLPILIKTMERRAEAIKQLYGDLNKTFDQPKVPKALRETLNTFKTSHSVYYDTLDSHIATVAKKYANKLENEDNTVQASINFKNV